MGMNNTFTVPSAAVGAAGSTPVIVVGPPVEPSPYTSWVVSIGL